MHVAPLSELRALLVHTANEIVDYREGAARGRVFPDLLSPPWYQRQMPQPTGPS